MGSGSHSTYTTGRGSQPYAPSYHVVDEELDKDKLDPNVYDANNGYFHNPSAVNIEDAIEGNRVIVDGKRPGGKITYVVDMDGNMIIGIRKNPNTINGGKCPHPTLIGGKNPEVQCAGMIQFKDGRIFSVNNDSGHFRPNKLSLNIVEAILDKLYDKNPLLFAKDSKWRKKNEQ